MGRRNFHRLTVGLAVFVLLATPFGLSKHLAVHHPNWGGKLQVGHRPVPLHQHDHEHHAHLAHTHDNDREHKYPHSAKDHEALTLGWSKPKSLKLLVLACLIVEAPRLFTVPNIFRWPHPSDGPSPCSSIAYAPKGRGPPARSVA